jgi:type II secretory pathway pseudopilin PulG
MAQRPQRHVRTPRSRGFTLLETALAMIIVVTGVLAIMEAQGAFIRSNRWSSHEATATYLGNEIRERMRTLPRHDPVTGLALVGATVVGLGRETNELIVDDLDDVDDYTTVMFGGVAPTFPGPINAYGEVIEEIDTNGAVVMSGGAPAPLFGWSQYVLVEKVSPWDLSDVRPWSEQEAPTPPYPGRAVDQYPLRVTVTVFYQGPYDATAQPVTTMSWVTSR